MVLINGSIYPVEKDPIGCGYVRIHGSKIQEIGLMADCVIDPDEETVDCAGKCIFPGLIDAHTHLGLYEDSLGFEGEDGNEDTDPVTPHLRAIDAINPLDECFSEALSAGVTTVLTGPGSANPVGGQAAILKTAGVRVDDMIVRFPAAMKMALGENPKMTYHGKNQAPVTRMATTAIIRESLMKAAEYGRRKNEAETDEEMDPPDFDIKCESLLSVLSGELPVHFHAHRADDIFTAMRIAQEFNLSYALVHATEGHLIADDLSGAKVKLISGPFLTDRPKPEMKNLTAKSPGMLAGVGLKPAICTDHPVLPLKYLTLCAAVAIREGMCETDALKAVTLWPAELLGIADRVGSLAPGKDADMIICDGHPLDIRSRIFSVFVNGRRVR